MDRQAEPGNQVCSLFLCVISLLTFQNRPPTEMPRIEDFYFSNIISSTASTECNSFHASLNDLINNYRSDLSVELDSMRKAQQDITKKMSEVDRLANTTLGATQARAAHIQSDLYSLRHVNNLAAAALKTRESIFQILDSLHRIDAALPPHERLYPQMSPHKKHYPRLHLAMQKNNSLPLPSDDRRKGRRRAKSNASRASSSGKSRRSSNVDVKPPLSAESFQIPTFSPTENESWEPNLNVHTRGDAHFESNSTADDRNFELQETFSPIHGPSQSSVDLTMNAVTLSPTTVSTRSHEIFSLSSTPASSSFMLNSPSMNAGTSKDAEPQELEFRTHQEIRGSEDLKQGDDRHEQHEPEQEPETEAARIPAQELVQEMTQDSELVQAHEVEQPREMGLESNQETGHEDQQEAKDEPLPAIAAPAPEQTQEDQNATQGESQEEVEDQPLPEIPALEPEQTHENQQEEENELPPAVPVQEPEQADQDATQGECQNDSQEEAKDEPLLKVSAQEPEQTLEDQEEAKDELLPTIPAQEPEQTQEDQKDSLEEAEEADQDQESQVQTLEEMGETPADRQAEDQTQNPVRDKSSLERIHSDASPSPEVPSHTLTTQEPGLDVAHESLSSDDTKVGEDPEDDMQAYDNADLASPSYLRPVKSVPIAAVVAAAASEVSFGAASVLPSASPVEPEGLIPQQLKRMFSWSREEDAGVNAGKGRKGAVSRGGSLRGSVAGSRSSSCTSVALEDGGTSAARSYLEGLIKK